MRRIGGCCFPERRTYARCLDASASRYWSAFDEAEARVHSSQVNSARLFLLAADCGCRSLFYKYLLARKDAIVDVFCPFMQVRDDGLAG